MTTKRLYEVEVTYRIFVTADNDRQAEDWVEQNVTEWSSDRAESVVAMPLSKENRLPPEVQESLPWAADGLSEEETDKPIRWWLDRK